MRVPVTGRDEMADLARSFNEMGTQLEEAAQRQRQLETLRRDLVTWIGHDLRVPLTSMRVIVEALADGVVEDPATVERYLETANYITKNRLVKNHRLFTYFLQYLDNQLNISLIRLRTLDHIYQRNYLGRSIPVSDEKFIRARCLHKVENIQKGSVAC